MIKQDIKLNPRSITKKATKARRASMVIKVLSFNIQKNKLSHEKKHYLKLLKVEAKYYYNYLLSLSEHKTTDNYGTIIYPNNLFDFNTKSDLIKIFNYINNTYYEYELKVLSSQVKQEILKKIQSSIKSLSSAKAKGRKVGKVKFKSLVNIPFKQFNNSFYLSDDCKKLSIQGNKKTNFHLVRNKNLNKLSKELNLDKHGKVSLKKLIDLGIIEIANAEIVNSHKKDSYKFNLTVYIKPEYLEQAKLYQGTQLNSFDLGLCEETKIGLDAGIASEITINVGETYASISINSRKPVNKYQENKLKRQKKYQKRYNRNISKAKKYKNKQVIISPVNSNVNDNNQSINKATYILRNNEEGYKTRSLRELKSKIENEQLSLNNHKLDTVRKLDSVMSLFKQISFQDEMIKSWHANKKMKFSNAIQKGILGKVYAKLKQHYESVENIEKNYQYKLLSKRLRTTKTCICGVLNKNITLKDREYFCSECGYINERDTHSSYIINNTINHINYNIGEYKKELPVCGKQTVEEGELILASNLGKITTSMKTELICKILSSKLKSNNVIISLNITKNLEASSFRAE